jgi:transposase-like protein
MQGGKGKVPVVALVERGRETRSLHVANVTVKTLRPILVKHASRKSYPMTDDSKVYPKTGKEFAGHGSVNHSAEEYVHGTFWHTNTVESHFALLKRGVYGTFHNISEAHLHRYLTELDFRANTRSPSDADRAALLLAGTAGKRLVYQQAR